MIDGETPIVSADRCGLTGLFNAALQRDNHHGVRNGMTVGSMMGTLLSSHALSAVTYWTLIQPSTVMLPILLVTRHHCLSAERPVTGSREPANIRPMAC